MESKEYLVRVAHISTCSDPMCIIEDSDAIIREVRELIDIMGCEGMRLLSITPVNDVLEEKHNG